MARSSGTPQKRSKQQSIKTVAPASLVSTPLKSHDLLLGVKDAKATKNRGTPRNLISNGNFEDAVLSSGDPLTDKRSGQVKFGTCGDMAPDMHGGIESPQLAKGDSKLTVTLERALL